MKKEKNSGYNGIARDFILGGISGAIGKTATAPIERVKLILQVQDSTKYIRHQGIIDSFRQIIKTQGFLSLWKGNTANIIRYFPTQALNFALKDKYKKIFVRYTPEDNMGMFFMGNLASGGAAGVTSLLAVYPLDFVRTRLAADITASGKTEFNGTIDCIRKIYTKNGMQGLYKGFGVSVAGIIVYRAAFFGLFDTCKAVLKKSQNRNPDSKFTVLESWIMAQSVSTTAGLISYPFDTIRRRMMMQTGSNQIIYKSTFDCWKMTIRKEGTSALFKGAFSNVIRSVGGALVLVVYDKFHEILDECYENDIKHTS